MLRRDNSAQPGNLEALGTIHKAIGEIDLLLSALAEQREPVISFGLIEALDKTYPPQVIEQQQSVETSESEPPFKS